MIFNWIKFIHDLIARMNVKLTAVGILILGIFGMIGMIQYNQTSDFCQKCHVNRGPFKNIDLDSVAHQPFVKGEKSCLDCHSDKDFHMFAKETIIAGIGFFDRVTNHNPHDRFEQANVPDSDCLGCHHKILEQTQAEVLELPVNLARIGLVFDHNKHFHLKEFSFEQQVRYEKLNSQTNPTEKQKEELLFLDKVRLGNCGQCHERNQPVDLKQGKRKVNRNIHYYATNPLRCSGCHVDSVTAAHPGQPLTLPLQLPDEQSCQRCHNGRLHGRLVTFPARCDAQSGEAIEHCKKCHPNIVPGVDYKTRAMDQH